MVEQILLKFCIEVATLIAKRFILYISNLPSIWARGRTIVLLKEKHLCPCDVVVVVNVRKPKVYPKRNKILNTLKIYKIFIQYVLNLPEIGRWNAKN